MKFITDSHTLGKIEDWAEELIDRIRVEMHNAGLDASGNLSSSLEYVIENENDGTTHIKVLAANYFIYAEGGRKSGKVPYNFVEILKEWISNKGLSVNQKEDARFAFLIARKIRQYGSKRYRENKPADVLSKPMSEMKPKLNEILENSIIFYINDELFH